MIECQNAVTIVVADRVVQDNRAVQRGDRLMDGSKEQVVILYEKIVVIEFLMGLLMGPLMGLLIELLMKLLIVAVDTIESLNSGSIAVDGLVVPHDQMVQLAVR